VRARHMTCHCEESASGGRRGNPGVGQCTRRHEIAAPSRLRAREWLAMTDGRAQGPAPTRRVSLSPPDQVRGRLHCSPVKGEEIRLEAKWRAEERSPIGIRSNPKFEIRKGCTEVQEKSPAGGLGVSPNFLFSFPQDWGIQGVETRLQSSGGHSPLYTVMVGPAFALTHPTAATRCVSLCVINMSPKSGGFRGLTREIVLNTAHAAVEEVKK